MSATSAAEVSSRDRKPLLRPVPRRRSAPFTLKPVDLLWLAALAAISVALTLQCSLPTASPQDRRLALPFGTGSVLLSTVSVYVIGLRLKDRSTAVIAGWLVATSLALTGGAAFHAPALELGALVAFSFLCFALDWTVAALFMAGVVTLLWANGVLLAAVLCLVALAQRKPYRGVGILTYSLMLALCLGLWLVPWRPWLSAWQPHGAAPNARLAIAALAPLAWFVFAYLAEWAQPADRAKWWGMALWLGLFAAESAVVHAGGSWNMLATILPITCLSLAVGIARLLPVFAGEMGRPVARYAVAIGAVAALIAARAYLEWPAIRTANAQSAAQMHSPISESGNKLGAREVGKTI